MEGKVVSQFGTENGSLKSLSTVFKVFLIFILLLTVPSGLDLSHLGGWVDRRRCPPRARVMIGPAASAQQRLFSLTSWFISALG